MRGKTAMTVCRYTFEGVNLKVFFFPSEKVCTLKGQNLLPLRANSFLLELTLFHKDMAYRKAIRQSQNLSVLKTAVTLP